jgi:Ca2+:H+ antiporter
MGLLFTLRTHRHIFSPSRGPSAGELHEVATWSVQKSVLVLLAASVAVAFVAELLVGSAEQIAIRFGWNELFIGVILLAIIGNAAEHSTAILLAKNDDMDTAMTITHQSSLQIALFAVPLLVLLSTAMAAAHIGKSQNMDLLFTPMEVVAVMLSVAIVTVLGLNGESNWFEGMLLLAVYMILAIVFFYIPGPAAHGYDAVTVAPVSP